MIASFSDVNSIRRSGVKSDSEKPLFVNFILDETGSMYSVKGATIDSFNEYITGLKTRPTKEVSSIRFTLTQFNSEKTQVIQNAVELTEVRKLTSENYNPNYATPLYDAIGNTISSMQSKAEGSNVLCVIQTDGYENASREWDRQKIFDLITKKQKEGWTFAFLGADQDAWVAGGAMGIPNLNTLSYTHSNVGTRDAMSNLTSATAAYSSTGGLPTADFFSGKIDIREKDKTKKKRVTRKRVKSATS
jgi:hypothetical protein